MFYLTTHSTHFINGYMASDIWLRTILIVRKETRCRHIGYSYRLTERVLLYAPSHRQDNTYHSLCYTSRGALAGTRSCVETTTRYKNVLITNWNCVSLRNVYEMKASDGNLQDVESRCLWQYWCPVRVESRQGAPVRVLPWQRELNDGVDALQ